MSGASEASDIRVLDTTLREGCQAPGVRLDAEASAEIAILLEAIGVDTVECGHPAISADECSRIKAVRAVLQKAPLLCHARATIGDVRAAADVGADWIGIFLGLSPLSLSAGHSMSRSESLVRIVETTREALRLGMRVRFTLEDASRTERATVLEAFDVALEAGADRICYADTVGVREPHEVGSEIAAILARFPGADVEVHLHDDRGLALANALAAIKAGASWISSSVNGLGERCGVVDTATLLANLAFVGDREIKCADSIQTLSRRVAAHARACVDDRRPVVGRHAFTHTAKLHRLAVKREARAYEWMEPEQIGRVRSHCENTLNRTPEKLVTFPSIISATELRHHRHGPGERYVMIDERFVPDCRQYCIVRRVPLLASYGNGHVDRHSHVCDSLFLFVGESEKLSGLTVEVSIGDQVMEIQSPASVFVPAGIAHSYRVLAGTGLFVNHVLSGSYDESLLDPLRSSTEIR